MTLISNHPYLGIYNNNVIFRAYSYPSRHAMYREEMQRSIQTQDVERLVLGLDSSRYNRDLTGFVMREIIRLHPQISPSNRNYVLLLHSVARQLGYARPSDLHHDIERYCRRNRENHARMVVNNDIR